MQIYDLRSYLALLEQHGQLVRVQRPVSLIHKVADVAATCEWTGGPAPLFEQIYLPRRCGTSSAVCQLAFVQQHSGQSRAHGAGL